MPPFCVVTKVLMKLINLSMMGQIAPEVHIIYFNLVHLQKHKFDMSLLLLFLLLTFLLIH